jgi:stage IV sporulation protein B
MKGRRRIAPAAAMAALLLWALPAQALAVGELVPMGCAVGIELETDGVTVAGFSEVKSERGTLSPAAAAGLRSGDVICAVDGRKTQNAQELLSALTALDGKTVELTVKRGGEALMVRVKPVRGPEGRWLLGLWLRDGVSGIGTVTYYDPENGRFGALGHGINDLESGKLLPFDGGSITDAAVVDVVKGAPGAPGELCGQPDRDKVLGSLERNTGCGVFGVAGFEDAGTPVPIAAPEEVYLGPASILATVNGGGVQEYAVEISRIYRQPEDHRFLMLTVTDPRLLAATGGIVQGMSGSPILQDGKLVGAVTHVLLSDATRGYGIAIQDMLDAAA